LHEPHAAKIHISSRPLAPPLTTLFFVDLLVSFLEARTWETRLGWYYEVTSEGNAVSLTRRGVA
jgi:hypothetical protein